MHRPFQAQEPDLTVTRIIITAVAKGGAFGSARASEVMVKRTTMVGAKERNISCGADN